MNPSSLADLKDIHLPPPISIFPITIGWYILAILIIIILSLFIYWQIKYFKYRAKINNIESLLAKIEATSKEKILSNQSEEILINISILLKRVAIDKFPQHKPHTLYGENWLMFLDKTGKTDAFTNGEGHYLRNVYQKFQFKDPELFFAVIKNWLRVVL